MRPSCLAMILSASASAALLVGPATAQEVTIATAAGDVTLAANPSKVAVFDTAAADMLDALGVPMAGLPLPLNLGYVTESAPDAVSVGTLFEPDYEALARLAPDLIIAGGRSAAVVEPLSAVATTIDVTLSSEDRVDDVRARLLAYGQLFGREAEAETLVADLDAKVDEARAAVAGKGEGLIVLVNGGRLSAFGAGSRFGWIHDDLGLAEAAPEIDVGTHGEAVSFEYLAEVDPDWLLVIDRGAAIGEAGEAAAAVLDTPLVADTTAGREGHIVYLDPARLYIAAGGVQSTMGTMDELIAAFGPAAEG